MNTNDNKSSRRAKTSKNQSSSTFIEKYLINYNDDAEHDFVYVSEPNLSHAYDYLMQPHYLL